MSSSHAPLTRNSRVSETSHRYRRPVASHDAPARSVPIMCRDVSGKQRTHRGVWYSDSDRFAQAERKEVVKRQNLSADMLRKLEDLNPELLMAMVAALQNNAAPATAAPAPDKLDLALAKARKKGLILGLQGSTRNVRFPDWQIGENGVVLSGLADLFDALGPDPWSVYRFLIQTHPALGGVSARDALNAGLTDRVIDLAHDIARGAVT